MRHFMKCLPLIALVLLSATGFSQAVEMTLAQAQEYAIKNSFSVRSANYNAESAKYTTESLKSVGLPQINGSVAFQNYIYAPYSIIPAGTFGPDEFRVRFGNPYTLSVGATASQLLFDGTYLVALQASKSYEKLQSQTVKQTEVQVKSDVANVYYLTLISQESAKLLNEAKVQLAKTLDETTALFQNGFTEAENVDQLQLSVNDLNIQFTYAEEQAKLTKDLLKYMIGMPISQEITLSETLDSFISQSSADLLSTTFVADNNMDVQVAKSTLHLQELNLKAKKAAYLPTLSTFINFQTAAYRQEFNLFDSNLPYFYGNLWGINLNVPILSGGQRKNEVKKVEVETKRATDLVNTMQQASELEFRNSRTELSNALQAYNSSKSSVELAKSIQDKTQIKFKEGIGTSFDVTQRNTQLIQSQGAYVEAMLKVLNAKTRLQKALNQL